MREIRSADLEWIEGDGYQKKVLLADESLRPPRPLLQLMRFRSGEAVPPHYHKVQTEAFIFLDRGAITIEGERLEMQKGDVLVCEPGEVHEVPAQEEFCIVVLKLNFEGDDTIWIRD